MPRLNVLLTAATLRMAAATPCTPTGTCTDDKGDTWELGPIAAEQIVAAAVPDATYTYKYAFSIYKNLDPVPQICQTFGYFGMNVARYDEASFGTCEQLGPDLNPTTSPVYQCTKTDDGLKFQYAYSGNSFILNLKCKRNAGKGTADAATAAGTTFTVNWDTNYACEGGAAQGGSEGDDRGWDFLIALTVISIIYLGAGFYYNMKTKGMTGVQAIPNLEFWRTVPGLVTDGAIFTKLKVEQYQNKGDGTTPSSAITPATGKAGYGGFADVGGGPTDIVIVQGDAPDPLAEKGALLSAKTTPPGGATPTRKKKKKKKKKPAAETDASGDGEVGGCE